MAHPAPTKRWLEAVQQYSISSLLASPAPESVLVENTKCLPSCRKAPTIVWGFPVGPVSVPENELPSCASIFIFQSWPVPWVSDGLLDAG